MFKKRKKYMAHEGLRSGMSLTLISGFINAYTYLCFNQQFAGVQTGNLLMFGIRLAQGQVTEALRFLLAILVFMLGQGLTYLLQRLALHRQYHWYLFSSLLMTGWLLLTLLFFPLLSQWMKIACLALFASLQVEAFKSLRGATYANVMMTGNIKNVAYLLAKGLFEKDKMLLSMAWHTFCVLCSFVVGVLLAVQLTIYWGEASLVAMLLPLFYLNYRLYCHVKIISAKLVALDVK